MYHHQQPSPAFIIQYPQPELCFQEQLEVESEVNCQFCGMFYAVGHLIGLSFEAWIEFMVFYGILNTSFDNTLFCLASGLVFLATMLELTFFGLVIFLPRFISGRPPPSKFSLLGISLLIQVVNFILMSTVDDIVYNITGKFALLMFVFKFVVYGIVFAVYSQNDDNKTCCLGLKPWISLSTRIIQNYYPPLPPPPPPQPVPIFYTPAVHPVSPVLSVNYLPGTIH